MTSYYEALFFEVFMSEKSWGTKRVCLFCSTSFYDFNKSPINCPKCGERFEQGLIFKRKTKTKDFEEIEDVLDNTIDDVDEIDTDIVEEEEV